MVIRILSFDLKDECTSYDFETRAKVQTLLISKTMQRRNSTKTDFPKNSRMKN